MNTKEVRDYVDELVCRASQPDFVLSEIEREHMKLVLAIYPDTLKRKTGQFMVDIGRRAPRPTPGRLRQEVSATVLAKTALALIRGSNKIKTQIL
jgi:hypothetical protein